MVKNIRIADMNSYIAAFDPEPVTADTRSEVRKYAELPQVEDITEPEEVKEEIPVEPVKTTRKKATKK